MPSFPSSSHYICCLLPQFLSPLVFASPADHSPRARWYVQGDRERKWYLTGWPRGIVWSHPSIAPDHQPWHPPNAWEVWLAMMREKIATTKMVEEKGWNSSCIIGYAYFLKGNHFLCPHKNSTNDIFPKWVVTSHIVVTSNSKIWKKCSKVKELTTMIWYDMIWYDMIWYDMIWYDMIWYDKAQSTHFIQTAIKIRQIVMVEVEGQALRRLATRRQSGQSCPSCKAATCQSVRFFCHVTA